MANALTDAALRSKWRGTDRELKDGGARGAGRLVARIIEGGTFFYFQYFDADGRHRRLAIGEYGKEGDKLSLQAARDKAADYSRLYRDGIKDLHAHFKRIQEATERAIEAERDAAQRAQADALRSTLRQLLDAYITHQQGAEKQSAGDARRIFEKHLYEAAPDVAAKRAADVTVDEFVQVIGKVVNDGKGRTAAKLRSYLRAAYAMAIASKTDPAAPLILRSFGIVANPLASIGALSQFNQTRDRNLSADELRSFLKRMHDMPEDLKKDALFLCLMLGGQRPAQLVRAKPLDVDLSAATITLYDPKGKRKEPRRHVLPLTKKPLAILEQRIEALPEGSPFIFTGDGKHKLRPGTLSVAVAEISAAMVEEKEAREAFQLRDIRRTCETMMAAMGVSSDVRAQVQSHGLGGVQNRHYDRHTYALEKQAALVKWQRYLDGLMTEKPSKVLEFGKKKVSK